MIDPETSGRRDTLRLLVRTGRSHSGALWAGILFSVGVVATRLALPWPLRGLMEEVFRPEGGAMTSRSIQQPILIFCGSYLVLAVMSGLFEMMQRVRMARFSSRTAHDLRASAVTAVAAAPGGVDASGADLLTRIIGDSARVKTNLQGILIHVTQNGLLLVGVTVLFLFIAPKLGLLFLVAVLLAVLIGMLNVDEVEQTALKARKKESRYAARVHEDDLPVSEEEARFLNASSARKDVRTTRLIGKATLWAHAAVAAVISLALWVGSSDVLAGRLAAGELFLFVAYALMIHRRAVRVGRQVARGGKLMACAGRIGALITPVPETASAPSPSPPRIQLQDVRVPASPVLARKSRLKPLDLAVEPGSHVLFLGSEGAGVTTLLEVLSGRLAPSRGSIRIDGGEAMENLNTLRRQVAYLGQDPELGHGLTPRMLCGLESGEEPSADVEAVMKSVGAMRVIRSLAAGWDQPLATHSLSMGERRSLLLGSILVGRARVWALDRPVPGKDKVSRRRLEAVIQRAAGKTLLVGQDRPCIPERFHRIVVLRRGAVSFDGTPEAWTEWRLKESAQRRIAEMEEQCPPTEG